VFPHAGVREEVHKRNVHRNGDRRNVRVDCIWGDGIEDAFPLHLETGQATGVYRILRSFQADLPGEDPYTVPASDPVQDLLSFVVASGCRQPDQRFGECPAWMNIILYIYQPYVTGVMGYACTLFRLSAIDTTAVHWARSFAGSRALGQIILSAS